MQAAPSLIESRSNPKYRRWLEIATNPQRPDIPWIPVEGLKQVEDLAGLGPIPLLLFEGPADARRQSLIDRADQAFQLSPRLMKTLSAVGSPQGLVAFVEKPCWEWSDMGDFVLFLEGLQDPGNLGTLVRTCLAAGGAVAASADSVSFFNRKVVRASAAALFSVPFREGARLEDLKERGFDLWAATPAHGESLFESRFDGPTAVLLGGEGSGLSSASLGAAMRRLRIPMRAGAESLNAGVAGALILYEAFRQRPGP